MRREVRQITDTAEWLRWRRTDITASRVAALFDAHPYLTREQLAAQLRGISEREKQHQQTGRRMEPWAASLVGEDNPEWILTKADSYHRIPELRLGATPDYWVAAPGLDGVLQIKTVYPAEWNKWHGKPPLAYTLQTLCEMVCADKPHGKLAVLVRADPFPVYVFDIPRHREAENRLVSAVADWWNGWDCGAVGDPYEPSSLESLLDDGSVADLSDDNALPGLLDDRAIVKERIRMLENQLFAIESDIKGKVGAARRGFLPGWEINYPTVSGKEYTVAAKQYRRLTIKRVEA